MLSSPARIATAILIPLFLLVQERASLDSARCLVPSVVGPVPALDLFHGNALPLQATHPSIHRSTDPSNHPPAHRSGHAGHSHGSPEPEACCSGGCQAACTTMAGGLPMAAVSDVGRVAQTPPARMAQSSDTPPQPEFLTPPATAPPVAG